MHFTLSYSGPLHANGKPKKKQAIRRQFHLQLKNVVEGIPGLQHIFGDKCESCGFQDPTCFEEFCFQPIITEKRGLVSKLDITWLRPEPPGRIFTTSGDIDNRLKTLFDALSVPSHNNQLPNDDEPQDGESPFYCLLEDDNLITSIAVDTDTLWETEVGKNDVVLLIRVEIGPIHGDPHK